MTIVSTLCAALGALSVGAGEAEEALATDAMYIVETYVQGAPSLDRARIRVRPHMFPSTVDLYHRVYERLSRIGRTCELLEMMPYIDEYLFWIESMVEPM